MSPLDPGLEDLYAMALVEGVFAIGYKVVISELARPQVLAFSKLHVSYVKFMTPAVSNWDPSSMSKSHEMLPKSRRQPRLTSTRSFRFTCRTSIKIARSVHAQ